MSIVEFLPGADWREHIAAYWVRKTEPDTGPSGRRVYADGCADLICNAGENTAYFYPMARRHKVIPLYPGRLYLGGTMTAYGVLRSDAGCLLTGIRFWPGGFYALFSQTMQVAVDSLIEFPEGELCTLMRHPENLATRLDRWLGDRSAPGALRNTGGYDFAFLRKRMYDSGGQTSVEALAEDMHVSNRTLERIFKKNVGIPPKEFLRIVRFQEVLSRLRKASGKHDLPEASRESLLHIAYDLGYFDHAHLTHEVKKYAGILPSELSHFYKTGLSGGQYF
ncbi:helix-turn-helix domain-containing protein [Spirosoma sp. HMF4905]|uniref:Helix-turn-helix domain-containing protein n=1 Tax=Spirosoma arboris TaxID=2682092 RepID=A0A7K1SCU3_9BACT|nr:helix-turn-helix transcriptional regulator [Spirosoma arboris]MVM31366.1 helix-turn-helix domain-containing protein [Spirosoma arboris]